jgi:hypothetical protein
MSMSRSLLRGASYKNTRSLSVIYVTLQEAITLTVPEEESMR